jgi:hypothetical protein
VRGCGPTFGAPDVQRGSLELDIGPLQFASSLARKPGRKQISSMVASRGPYQLLLAAAISFSTSRFVRCLRGRHSLLERPAGHIEYGQFVE